MVKALKKAGLDDEEPGGKSSFGDIAEGLKPIILGAIEKVIVAGRNFSARIDSGAENSSICESLVGKFKLGPVVDEANVRSANGSTSRDVILIPIKLKGLDIVERFNVSDRRSMMYPVLIGRNILERGFLVDVTK